MKEYNILETDYNKTLCKTKEAALEKAKENSVLLQECMEKDSFLSQLEESRRDDFLAFAFNCNMIAAQVRGEISVALDPDSGASSIVIVSERFILSHPVSALFAKAISYSEYFSAEPVEENSSKLVLYFHFLF